MKAGKIEDSSWMRDANGRTREGDAGYVKSQYGRIYNCAMKYTIDEVMPELGPEHKFLDIGAGIGNTVHQVALMYGCDSRGIEINKARNDIGLMNWLFMEPDIQKIYLPHGSVELLEGHIEDAAYLKFIFEADFVFVNNYNGVFKKNTEQQSRKEGYAKHPDYHVAALFAQMKVGTVMVTMENITEIGRSQENIAEDLERRGEEVKGKNLSFFNERSFEMDIKQPFTWSSGSHGKYEVHVYTRLDQRSEHCGKPLREWSEWKEEIEGKAPELPPKNLDERFQQPHQFACKDKICIEWALDHGVLPMVLAKEKMMWDPNSKESCTMIDLNLCNLCD